MPTISRTLSLLILSLFVLSASAPGHADEPALHAVSAEALRASLPPEIQLETLPGGYAVALPEPFAPSSPAIDPVYHVSTSRSVYLYAPTTRGSVTCRVVVHYEPDDREAAARGARLIARLLRLQRQHFGRDLPFPRDASMADIWFVPAPSKGATEGGETRDANIYVFAASGIHKELELVRTIAHEWGHLTIPAARGYAEPEYDAAGYLGERLHMNWLYQESLKPGFKAGDDGTSPADLALYYHRQVEPLIDRWNDGGPESPLLDGDRTISMDYYIGAVLGFDEALGSSLAGKAMFSIDDEHPRDFLKAAERVVASAAQSAKGFGVTLPGWVPLEGRAKYSVAAASGAGTVAFNDRSPLTVSTKCTATLRAQPAGWAWIHAVSGNVTALTIKRPTDDQPE